MMGLLTKVPRAVFVIPKCKAQGLQHPQETIVHLPGQRDLDPVLLP